MDIETDKERAKIMVSLYPPTNQILLKKWAELAQDSDLKDLINCWINYIEGKLDNSSSYEIPHEKVLSKLNSNFFD